MPIYRYRCEACNREFSVRESKPNLNKTKDCIEIPFCNGTAIRIVAKSSFALKGSGWFKDGY